MGASPRFRARMGTSTRETVMRGLAAAGIASGRYFAPIHLQPAWRNHPGAVAARLPVTESIARRTLALPFFNCITLAQQQQVADALLHVLRSEN